MSRVPLAGLSHTQREALLRIDEQRGEFGSNIHAATLRALKRLGMVEETDADPMVYTTAIGRAWADGYRVGRAIEAMRRGYVASVGGAR